jgi:hypothetical protein
MWKFLKMKNEECRKFQDGLEEFTAARPAAGNLQELLAVMAPAEREHVAACADCREAAQDFVASRKILRGMTTASAEAGPGFATRVMNVIAARERELANLANAWSEVPRFASRLAWASAIALLVGSTWLYEKPAPATNHPLTVAASQESLFETAPPANQDDVLIGVTESN